MLSSSSNRFERLRVLGQPLDTTEVRWFGSGTLDESWSDWFTGQGRAGIVEIRNDTYRISADPSVGLKRRDHGPLELKRRQGISPRLSLAMGLEGSLEEWQKTGLEEPLGDANWEWSVVEKVVLTRTFSLEESDTVAEVAGRALTTPACDVELASLTVGSTLAWTFALEAWGPREVRRRLLTKSLHSLLAKLPPPPRDLIPGLQHNMGYPEWLASVAWKDQLVSS